MGFVASAVIADNGISTHTENDRIIQNDIVPHREIKEQQQFQTRKSEF